MQRERFKSSWVSMILLINKQANKNLIMHGVLMILYHETRNMMNVIPSAGDPQGNKRK